MVLFSHAFVYFCIYLHRHTCMIISCVSYFPVLSATQWVDMKWLYGCFICLAHRSLKRRRDDEKRLQESCVNLLMRHQNTSELLLEITVSLRPGEQHQHWPILFNSNKLKCIVWFKNDSFCNSQSHGKVRDISCDGYEGLQLNADIQTSVLGEIRPLMPSVFTH